MISIRIHQVQIQRKGLTHHHAIKDIVVDPHAVDHEQDPVVQVTRGRYTANADILVGAVIGEVEAADRTQHIGDISPAVATNII